MKVIALATLENYSYHLLPILDELAAQGAEVRMVTTQKTAEWAEHVDKAKLGQLDADAWLAAGAVDYKSLENLRTPKKLVYVEHGVGQTYEQDERSVGHASYSHGVLPRVDLFLCPNVFVVKRREATHPNARVWLVGSPRMDYFHRWAMGNALVVPRVVAFAWHWACPLNAETMTAWEHYRPHLSHVAIRLRRAGLVPVMTAHPRIRRRVRYHAERSGFEWWDTDDVLMRAALLVADNTSLMYEFASLDRPVVALNAPWYRRTANHGLRFWEAIPGPQVDDFEGIEDAVREGLDSDPFAEVRRTVNAYVLPVSDGNASRRAAVAIERLVSSGA